MADIVKEISNRAEQALNIADQAVTDTDKLNELKFHLQQIIATSMLTGKGASITKITICGLVSFVVITVIMKWLLTGNVDGAMQLLPLVTPLIGMLIGAYGTGKTIQKISETKNGSQSTTMGSRKLRPPSSYRPTDDPAKDRGPSDTKRDHPSGR